MAGTHSKSEPATPQALRQSIVGYVPDTYRYPQIKLKGKWLEQAGFTTGTPLAVRVMNGCLVITSQPRTSLMNDVLHHPEQLSPQAQHELEQVIKGLMLREQLSGYITGTATGEQTKCD